MSGRRGGGTPVWIEKPFLDADLHLTLGFIEQHLMLGFSGGRKMIAPGTGGAGDDQGDSLSEVHAGRALRLRGRLRRIRCMQSCLRWLGWRGMTSCSM